MFIGFICVNNMVVSLVLVSRRHTHSRSTFSCRVAAVYAAVAGIAEAISCG